jgi:hypothetical protein
MRDIRKDILVEFNIAIWVLFYLIFYESYALKYMRRELTKLCNLLELKYSVM